MLCVSSSTWNHIHTFHNFAYIMIRFSRVVHGEGRKGWSDGVSENFNSQSWGEKSDKACVIHARSSHSQAGIRRRKICLSRVAENKMLRERAMGGGAAHVIRN